MNADGSGQKRLTNDPGFNDYPSWSPDGRKIAYLSKNGLGSYVIKLMNADGSEEVVLTGSSPFTSWARTWYAIDWFPDGSRLAIQDNGEVYTINSDGTNRTNVTNDGVDMDGEPSVSPDGHRIAFSSDRGSDPEVLTHVFVLDLDDQTTTGIATYGPYFADYAPTWSRTGTLAVVTNDYIDGGGFRLFFGTGPIYIFSPFADPDCPKWSPDGRKIVYSDRNSIAPGGTQLYVTGNDGSGTIQITSGSTSNYHPSWQPTSGARYDFDGDGRSDISVFRPSEGTWYVNRSTAGFSATQFGISTDKITPADFDGDHKADIAVFRDGTWYWLNSTTGTLSVEQFGSAVDIPVPGDYDGGGRDELAVYRNGVWWMLDLATRQISVTSFGLPTDQPVPADYDGDGKIDQAVFRLGEWHLNRSSLGYMVVNFGLAYDKPLPADYDGDGKADPTVYRDGTWYLDRSSQGVAAIQWGLAADTPTPADYDGDGKADLAVFRSGVWYLMQSSDGTSIQQFGLANDIPAPAAKFNKPKN